MDRSRFASLLLLAGCALFAPTAYAGDPVPVPAPPAPDAPAPKDPLPYGMDDLKRRIHEVELKLNEAKAAGREREQAELQGAIERLRDMRDSEKAARKAKEQAEALAKEAAQAESIRVTLRSDAKGKLFSSNDGGATWTGGAIVLEGDGDGELQTLAQALARRGEGTFPEAERKAMANALEQEQQRLLGALRAAEKSGADAKDIERLRERSKAMAETIGALSRGKPGLSGDANCDIHYYQHLDFAPPALAGLDRRLGALRQSVKLLKEAGLGDRARGLQEDIARLERERAAAMAEAAAGTPANAAMAQEVHALREQLEALRHEVGELRELLKKLGAK